MIAKLSAHSSQRSVLLILLIGAFFFVQSCATSRGPDMAAVASSNQKVSYDGTITSRKKHFVAISPYTELDNAIPVIGLAKEKPKFMLTVRNLGDSPIFISRGSVFVSVEDAGSGGSPRAIHIQSLDDFLADFEEEYNDGEKKYIYNKVYRIWSQVKYGFLSVERATDYMRDFKQNLESMRRQKKVLLRMLPDTFLADRSIMPGSSYTGIVVCDSRNLSPGMVGNFIVSVSLDGEKYNFTFHRTSSL